MTKKNGPLNADFRLSSQDHAPSSTTADRQAFFILKKLGAAVREFELIRDDDRIAMAVSGGKDSLGLLRLLKAYRRSAGVRFELAAIHVLGDATGVIELHHRSVNGWPRRTCPAESSCPSWPLTTSRR